MVSSAIAGTCEADVVDGHGICDLPSTELRVVRLRSGRPVDFILVCRPCDRELEEGGLKP